MLVFELPLKICILSPLPFLQAAEKIGRFIESALWEVGLYPPDDEASYAGWPYTFDLPFPIESGLIYQPGKIYTVRIRTIRQELAEFFVRRLPVHQSEEMQGLSGELKIIPRFALEKVYTLTPVVMKMKCGYWRNRMKVPEYEERLKRNLIRKYRLFGERTLSADFPLSCDLSFTNRKPVRVPYQDKALLGDKLSLTASQNESAQELLYMALGTGMGENNTGGCGFLSYRFR